MEGVANNSGQLFFFFFECQLINQYEKEKYYSILSWYKVGVRSLGRAITDKKKSLLVREETNHVD